MKKIFLILGILIIADISYFSFVNQGQSLTLNYKPLIKEFVLDSGWTYLFMGLYGVLGGFLLAYSKNLELNEKIKKLSRNVEKSSIVSEESSDKVKALESKIQTLEVALKEALNKK
jgi:hypothetical protein